MKSLSSDEALLLDHVIAQEDPTLFAAWVASVRVNGQDWSRWETETDSLLTRLLRRLPERAARGAGMHPLETMALSLLDQGDQAASTLIKGHKSSDPADRLWTLSLPDGDALDWALRRQSSAVVERLLDRRHWRSRPDVELSVRRWPDTEMGLEEGARQVGWVGLAEHLAAEGWPPEPRWVKLITHLAEKVVKDNVPVGLPSAARELIRHHPHVWDVVAQRSVGPTGAKEPMTLLENWLLHHVHHVKDLKGFHDTLVWATETVMDRRVLTEPELGALILLEAQVAQKDPGNRAKYKAVLTRACEGQSAERLDAATMGITERFHQGAVLRHPVPNALLTKHWNARFDRWIEDLAEPSRKTGSDAIPSASEVPPLSDAQDALIFRFWACPLFVSPTLLLPEPLALAIRQRPPETWVRPFCDALAQLDEWTQPSLAAPSLAPWLSVDAVAALDPTDPTDAGRLNRLQRCGGDAAKAVLRAARTLSGPAIEESHRARHRYRS